MLVVAALGGNALLRRGEPADADHQRANVVSAIESILELAKHHRVVVTHGNGPQVGLLALQAEAYPQVAPYPLDVLGAESEGMIGYLLEQGLTNRLEDKPVATLLTQTVVDPADPAFQNPTKPIGPVYDQQTAQRLASERQWTVERDGEHWRRVVPSPEPRRIIELPTIRMLTTAGVLVICAGGGGVPVTIDEQGAVHGVEAVIDKDLAAALLARELDADALLLLTDVPHIERNYRTPLTHPVREASMRELDLNQFAAGSIRPKIQAAGRFADTGKFAAIGALSDAVKVLGGQAGTQIVGESAQTPIAATERAVQRLREREQEVDLDIDTARRMATQAHPSLLGYDDRDIEP